MKKIVIFILLVTVVVSCNSPLNDLITNGDDSSLSRSLIVEPLASFNKMIKRMPDFPQSTDSQGRTQLSKTTSGHYSETTYKATKEFKDVYLLDPTSDIMWLGCLIDPTTIRTGAYRPLTTPRLPYKISVNLQGMGGKPSKTIGTISESPSLSTYREGMTEILNQSVGGNTAAQINYSIEKVYSEDQLKLAIGGNYKYGEVASIKGKFNFNSKTIKNRVIVKFIQKYYTADMDQFDYPSSTIKEIDEFTELLKTDKIKHSPAYISSITYGRMALFTVESLDSEKQITAALEAAFKKGMHSGSAEVSTEYKKVLKRSKINVLVMGGSANSAIKSINGIEGIMTYIREGGNYSAKSPGVPLSYMLRSLKNQAVTAIRLTSQYKVREYIHSNQEYTVEVEKIICKSDSDAGNYAEFFGNLGYRIKTNGTVKPFENTAKNEYSKTLWKLGEDHAVDVREDSKTPTWINKRSTFRLKDSDPRGDYIEFLGTIKEDDGGGDDSLGSRNVKMFIKDIPFNDNNEYSLVVRYSGDDTILDVYYKVSLR